MEKKIKYIIREIPPEQCEFSYYFDNDGIKEAGGDFCYNLFIIMRERWNHVSGFQADEYQRISDQIREIAEDIEAGPGEYNGKKWLPNFWTIRRALRVDDITNNGTIHAHDKQRQRYLLNAIDEPPARYIVRIIKARRPA